MRIIRSRTYIATPPGATIKEQQEYQKMSLEEFALRMGMSEKQAMCLINGNIGLTPELACRLEKVLGVPADFWNRLEALYRQKIIKAQAEKALDEEKRAKY